MSASELGNTLLVCTTVSLILVIGLSSEAVHSLYRRLSPGKLDIFRPLRHVSSEEGSSEADILYKDEDGEASATSQNGFTTAPARTIALIAVALGFVTSIVGAVLKATSEEEDVDDGEWIKSATWLVLGIQALNLFVVRAPRYRFRLATVAAVSALCLLASTLPGLAMFVQDSSSEADVSLALVLIENFLVLAAFLALLSVQRRPNVSRGIRSVDGQMTVSLAGRISFNWALPTLNFARRNKKLELEDLPVLGTARRSQSLKEAFYKDRQFNRLWKTILFSKRWPFVAQSFLSLLASALTFFPQYTMFSILRVLEERENGHSVGGKPVAWVLALGVVMALNVVVESNMFWICYADLAIPIRAVLGALVFTKTIARKDVKEQAEKPDPKDPSKAQENPKNLNKTDAKEKEKAKDSDPKASRQAVVNLLGVDAARVGDFWAFTFFYPESVAKLTLSVSFLSLILGWVPLLSGLAAFSLSIPVNSYFSAKYTKAQGELMKQRDRKLEAVNEALLGIRQIKFSGTEKDWEEKIGKLRREELRILFMTFAYDSGLIACWIFSPICFSAVAILVYTAINGSLSASVAFPTISVFNVLQVTLSLLPELTTYGASAWQSLKRIEEYLNSDEVEDYFTEGKSVAYREATICWPSSYTKSEEGTERKNQFSLRDISLYFPTGELSVICGRTGSGKSLLLHSIIGEAERISGEIIRPKAPQLSERNDQLATRGNWILDSAIAFVSQIPWIENASIKDNILFGLPYDQGRYRSILESCALEADLAIMPDGELTEVGANGINISGGQKWRISLARALYSRAGILVLDDIFSAVDAHVARHLFEHALTGDLAKGRTRILVTHHTGLCLQGTRYMVRLDHGTVEYAGTIEELRERGELQELLRSEEEEEREEMDDKDNRAQESPEAQDTSFTAEEDEDFTANGDSDSVLKLVKTNSRRANEAPVDKSAIDVKGSKFTPKKFVEDEKRETGAIKLSVYKEYLGVSGGLLAWFPIVFTFAFVTCLGISRGYWLRIWTDDRETQSVSQLAQYPQHILVQAPRSYQITSSPNSLDFSVQRDDERVWFYLGVYLAISLAMWILGVVKYVVTFLASLRASRVLFNKLCYTVLRAPRGWFDTMPVGRILNRFTADCVMLDSQVSPVLASFINQSFEALSITIIGFFINPIVTPLAFLLLATAGFVGYLYLGGAREVKRLESNAKSPMLETYGTVLAGITTIRAWGKGEEYIQRMQERIDTHAIAFWHLWLFNRWLGFRIALIGAVFTMVIAFAIVSIPDMEAAVAGFFLAFALQFTSAIIWSIRQYATLEMDMNAVERVTEYASIDIEDQGGMDAPAAWPTEGRLEFNDVWASYTADGPAVLKGLTFTAEKGQRIGVVGRTGAGKSSLTLALFRFIDASQGQILIDGVDVSKIKLHDLRSRLAIIPQDPVLFSGTIRNNLDPFDRHDDAELWDALERVHLIEPGTRDLMGQAATSRAEAEGQLVDVADTPTNPEVAATAAGEGLEDPALTAEISTALPREGTAATTTTEPPSSKQTKTNPFASLSSPVSEGGFNLSSGQRQLLCLARALISRPRLMVLDEATSAVDMQTDEHIQRSVRAEFASSTLVVIAHRLSTIADFDRILVLKDGRAVEYGTPRELYLKGESAAGSPGRGSDGRGGGGAGGGSAEDGGGEEGSGDNAENLFRSMVDSSGEKERLREIILGDRDLLD